jgi:hypothetical protein
MTVPPGRSRDEASGRRYERRFTYASIAIVILLLALLAMGLKASIEAHRALCPPSNRNCAPLPPSGTAPVAPPATPPR